MYRRDGAGGTAVFDALLPAWLEELGVPQREAIEAPPGRPAEELAGAYRPAHVEPRGADRLTLAAPAMGLAEPFPHVRLHGDTFGPEPPLPGGMAIAFDDLLYLGPFAVPRR